MQEYTELFAGLRRAYGSYTLDGTTTDGGKRGGKAVTLNEELTDEHYNRHLTTDWTLGVVPIRDDGACVFAALDIDVYKGLDHKEVVAKVQRLGLPLVAVRSKSGGLHLYVFFREPVACGDVRAILKAWAAALGHARCEIFPKQETIGPDEVGNWINLPYQGALNPQTYGTERYGYDDSGAPISDLPAWLDYAHGKRTTAADFTRLHVEAQLAKGELKVEDALAFAEKVRPLEGHRLPAGARAVIQRAQGRLRQGAFVSALPAELVARIDAARRQLQRAAAVLACVAFAADHEADVDLGDAAQAACDLITSAVDALDAVQLARAADDG